MTKLEKIEWNDGTGLVEIVDEGMVPLLSFVRAINGLLMERDQENQFHTTLVDVLTDVEEKTGIIIKRLRDFSAKVNSKGNLFGEVRHDQT